MGLTHFPHGLSSFGAPVVPGPNNGKIWGNTWFVDTTNGSDANNDGKDRDTAFATITKAITNATADNGDVIYIRNGAYAETVRVNKNRISLVGESRGVTITGDEDATSSVIVSGSNCLIQTLSIAAYDTGNDLACLEITGDENTVRDIYFTDADGREGCFVNGGDETLIEDCLFMEPHYLTSPSGCCLKLEDSDRCEVRFCKFYTTTSASAIILHDADETSIHNNYAVGSSGATAATHGAFVYIDDGDAEMRCIIADNKAVLFAAGVAESGAQVAVHGFGTANINQFSTAESTTTAYTGLCGNDFCGCTLFFDTSV